MYFNYIICLVLLSRYAYSSELVSSEENYGLHTQAISAGHSASHHAHGRTANHLHQHENEEEIETDQNQFGEEPTPESEEEDDSQEDSDNQQYVQYIRVKYITRPVYKFLTHSPTASAPVTPTQAVIEAPIIKYIDAPAATTHPGQEPIVKYVSQRREQQLVKYIAQPQVVKYISPSQHQQRLVKIVPKRVVKVPQRVIYKYLPYYAGVQSENLQKVAHYKNQQVVRQQQQEKQQQQQIQQQLQHQHEQQQQHQLQQQKYQEQQYQQQQYEQQQQKHQKHIQAHVAYHTRRVAVAAEPVYEQHEHHRHHQPTVARRSYREQLREHHVEHHHELRQEHHEEEED